MSKSKPKRVDIDSTDNGFIVRTIDPEGPGDIAVEKTLVMTDLQQVLDTIKEFYAVEVEEEITEEAPVTPEPAEVVAEETKKAETNGTDKTATKE